MEIQNSQFYFDSKVDIESSYTNILKHSGDVERFIDEISPNFVFKGEVIMETDSNLSHLANITYDHLSKCYIAGESGYVQYEKGNILLLPCIYTNKNKTKVQVIIPNSHLVRNAKIKGLENFKKEIKDSNLELKAFNAKFRKIIELYTTTGGVEILFLGAECSPPVCGLLTLYPEKLGENDLSYQMKDTFLSYEFIKFAVKVYKNEALGTYRPAVEKKDGVDVFGKPIIQENLYPPDQFIGYGEGIRVDSKTNIAYADVEGLLKFNFNNVPAVCKTDVSYGHVSQYMTAEQDVRIEGSILSRSFIKAEGNIRVLGNIEGAKVVAKGEVIVEGGISNKAYIKAGRGVVCQFASNAFILTEGSVKVRKYILNSTIHAMGFLNVYDERKGRITGGEIRVGGNVTAAIGGSPNRQATYVEILKFPKRNIIKMQMEDIENQKIFIEEQLKKFKMIYGNFDSETKRKDNDINEERAERIALAKKEFDGMHVQLKELEENRLNLRTEFRKPVGEDDEAVAKRSNYSILFRENIYAGLKVIIRRQVKAVGSKRRGTEFYFNQKRSQILHRDYGDH